MGSACQKWLEKWVGARMAPIRLEDEVCLTSCFSKLTPTNILRSGEEAFGRFQSSLVFGQGEATRELAWDGGWRDDTAEESPRGIIHRVMNKSDGSGLRGVEMVLPNSWDIALTVLEALEHGRNPVEAVMQTSFEPHGGADRLTEPFKGITVEELNVRWKHAVDQLSTKGIQVSNPDHALEGALSIREFDGTVVRHEAFVFLDVIWLTIILKPLLNHKETRSFDGNIILGDKGDTLTTLVDERHIDSWHRFKNEGILEPELARVIWPDLFEYVLPTLAYLGLAFPLELDPADGLAVLLRLGTDPPDSVSKDIEKFRLKHWAVFDVCWELFLGVPPGVVETVLTRCCSIGTVQTFWRFGVLVQGSLNDSEGSGSFALVLGYSSDSNKLNMKVYGDICTVAPWAALAYAISSVKNIVVEFPGLRSRASIECPEDGHQTRMTITTSRPGEELLQGRGCNRCSRETGGIGAAAVELVRMMDVRQNRDALFREVNTRFVDVQRRYPALRPAELRDIHTEKFLSEQLKAARESFLADMKEDLAIVLRSAGASAASEPRGQDGRYQDWNNLNLKLEDIQRQLGGDKWDQLVNLEANVVGLQATIATMMDLLAADDGVMGRLDFLVAMLMAARGDKVDTPRQACILPGDYAEAHGLSDELRKPEMWTKKLEEWRESDFEAGKGVWKKKMRLFLICAHTHQLVPCGHNGRGYDVQRARQWVRKTVDVAKFALQVTCASLVAVAAAQLPAAIPGGVGEQAVESAFTKLEAKLEGLAFCDGGNETTEALCNKVQELKGNAYKCLRTFVHDMEDTSRVEINAATKKARKDRRAPPSASGFVYFEQVMLKVQPRTDDGEAQWVLKEHEQAWRGAARKATTG